MDNRSIPKKNYYFYKSLTSFKNKDKMPKILLALLTIIVILLIIAKPSVCINSVSNGLMVWAKTILPSLFPFMFFTKFLTSLDIFDGITKKFSKITKFLFRAPSISSYIFLMSIISGYPVGAKLISEFYIAGKITEKQANKLITFCSTSGPLFIIGSVGTAMFLNSKIGYILFLSHLLSTILNGILYRNKFVDFTEYSLDKKENSNIDQILPETMNNSILSCMIVGGYISIFFLVIEIFSYFGLFEPIVALLSKLFSQFGFSDTLIKSSLYGIIEMSKGCIELSKIGISNISVSIASFLISFGGLCTFFQAITFLSKCKIKPKFYLLQKLTHGVFSFILTFIFMKIMF